MRWVRLAVHLENKRAQSEVYWKVITWIIAIFLLIFLVVYNTGLKDKLVDLVSSFFNQFSK